MKALFQTKYLLLAIGVTLTAIHLHLIAKSGQEGGLLESCMLCWSAVWFLVWRKHESLKLTSSLTASTIGLLGIAWVLIRSLSISGYDSFLRILPLISGLSLVLIASGPAFKLYWRELTILAFLALPKTSLIRQFDISPITADFSTTILWYLGFPVSQSGVMIDLPNGSVEVYSGCSGILLIWHMLTLALLFLMLFPVGWVRSLIVTITAIAIGFIVNGLRVVLMAVLFAQGNQRAFDYWHVGNGSLIFSMVAALLFGGFCYVMLEQVDNEIDDEEVEA